MNRIIPIRQPHTTTKPSNKKETSQKFNNSSNFQIANRLCRRTDDTWCMMCSNHPQNHLYKYFDINVFQTHTLENIRCKWKLASIKADKRRMRQQKGNPRLPYHTYICTNIHTYVYLHKRLACKVTVLSPRVSPNSLEQLTQVTSSCE